jgi:Uma2 family endonuclease
MAIAESLPGLTLRSPAADWNRARWEQLPADGNRYEVIDGVLYMSTAPSFFHQWIIKRLAFVLDPQIDQKGIGLSMFSPIGLFMPGCEPVQPDVLVLRQAQIKPEIFQDGKIIAVPALLIEVQSLGHPSIDSKTKRGAYARAGVPEYWIIRPKSRDVLVCSQPDLELGDYASVYPAGPGGELVAATLPVRLEVSELFAGSPDTTL